MPKGTYLEIGANDGIWLSNSLWLHQARGWRGLLIEAHPTLAQQMIDNRLIHMIGSWLIPEAMTDNR